MQKLNIHLDERRERDGEEEEGKKIQALGSFPMTALKISIFIGAENYTIWYNFTKYKMNQFFS